MTEAAINRRKSQLFFTQISPVHYTYDEVVKKLKKGKFPQTKTGIIKMVSLCLQLGSVISWILLDNECSSPEIPYSTIICICLGFSGQLFLFLLFSLGKTVRHPGVWINADIVFNVPVSLITIVACVVFIEICHVSQVLHLSASMGISGAAVCICGCATLFLMYRFVEDPVEESPASKPVVRDPRKSIFA